MAPDGNTGRQRARLGDARVLIKRALVKVAYFGMYIKYYYESDNFDTRNKYNPVRVTQGAV